MALSSPKKISEYRELTTAAVILGVVQGIILNIAFTYAALKLGFSIGGSTIAAILGYVFLRGVLRKGTIVENNINQTIASGINSAGIGVVFVLPAAFLLSASNPELSFPLSSLLMGGVAGALLGVVLVVPLRRQLIEMERLRFPSGTAVAAVIRSGSAGADKVKLLLFGCMFSALWKLFTLSKWCNVPGLLEAEELNLSMGIIPAYLAPYLHLSLMNLAAGLLAGRAGLPFLAGGLLAWWVISPSSVMMGWVPPALSDLEVNNFIYEHMLRPLGIGVLIGAACIELIRALPLLRNALHTLVLQRNSIQSNSADDELSSKTLIVCALIAIVLLFTAVLSLPGISFFQALIAVILGTLWMALAGLIVAEATGLTDISPVSGIALVSVTIAIFLLNGHIVATILLTVAVSVAIAQAADVMQDLKTGFMVGSRPILQQIGQLATTWLGVLVSCAVIYVLWSSGPGGSHGFGPGTGLSAPQAGVLTGLLEAVGNNDAPLDKFALGGILGLLLGAAPIAGLGVLAGLAMYLPFSITLGYGLGCLAQMGIRRAKGAAFIENKLVPLAAGLIVGEALMSVGHAIFSIIYGGGG